ncbi:hypothetical protein LT679_04490 [Mucilaginibacter roseus]|uniref:Cell shape-determining protein MreB n=1 Tax=Mucilaginibacter roseus TaxID=1528868 RepID=A0ABS8TYB2_9SPHI|nr:hypothetical protein [Mucilaginibacter roseus]MCD8739851.1 hypothetical protein [Mucilaginibacter roseus]
MNFKSIALKALYAPALVAVSLSSCKKDSSIADNQGDFNKSSSAYVDSRTAPTVTSVLPNIIGGNRTLSRDTTYILNGPTYVTNNSTLTIQSGTFIKGRARTATTSSLPSYLLITKGANVQAVGTSAQPIVFTSTAAAGARKPGDWAGVVILGNGITNAGLRPIEGISADYVTTFGLPFPSTIQYGTNVSEADANAASRLSYVRIEYAGAVLETDNELNGLTLGGVGSATTLDHIQVSYGADDAFEFFGGSVNAKYLIAQGNNDDDFDFDQGYQGTIQYAVSVKDASTPAPQFSSNPNGIESNNVTAPVTATTSRLTSPLLTNLTILGLNPPRGPLTGTTYGIGVVFRVSSAGTFANSVVGGFDIGSALLTSATTTFQGNYGQAFTTAGPAFTSSTVNATANANNALRLASPFNVAFTGSTAVPDFRYLTSPVASPAASGFTYAGLTIPHPGGAVTALETPSYRGAFGASSTTRWDVSPWVSYNSNANVY